MSHLDEGTLTALLDGELAAEERRRAEEHLAGCGECRRLYEEVRGFAGEADQLVDSVQPAAPAPQKPGRPVAGPGWDRLRPLAWAATLVIAAGLGWSASARRFSQSPGQGDLDRSAAGLAEQQAPSAPATPPVPDPGGAYRPPQDARERAAAPSQDKLPERQATEPPVPVSTDMAKAAAPLAEADEGRNVAGRTESPVRGNRPAAALAAEPLQARAAEATGPRDAPSPAGRFEETGLEEAVRVLGGTVKLIDGLNPIRVQIGPPQRLAPGGLALDVVRIIYLDPPGRELWLDQQRSPAPIEGRAGPPPALGLLAGDTLITAAGDGLTRVRWISPDGFRLALTGYLPGDSLRILVRRVH